MNTVFEATYRDDSADNGRCELGLYLTYDAAALALGVEALSLAGEGETLGGACISEREVKGVAGAVAQTLSAALPTAGLIPPTWDDYAAADIWTEGVGPMLPLSAEGNEIHDASGGHLGSIVGASTTRNQDDVLTQLIVRLVNSWAAQAGLLK